MVSSCGSSLLIDFDGVVFRNRLVADAVKEKSIRYVASRKHVSYHEAAKMNTIGYTTLGHSARVVSDDPSYVKDYNDYVFDSGLYRIIQNTVNREDAVWLQTIH